MKKKSSSCLISLFSSSFNPGGNTDLIYERGLKLVEISIRQSKKKLIAYQKYCIYLVTIACIFITIPFFLVPSYASKSIHVKAEHIQQEPQASINPNQAKTQDLIARLHQLNVLIAKLDQLNIETRKPIQFIEGYSVAAEILSSQTNIDRTVKRLASAGLEDKTHPIEVAVDHSRVVDPVKTQMPRSTLANVNRPYTKDKFVPKKQYEKLEREVEILKAQMQSLLKLNSYSKTNVEQVYSDVPPRGEDSQSEIPIAETFPVDTPDEKESRPETHIAQTSTEEPNIEKDSQAKKDLGGADGSREEEAEDMKRQLDTFLRRQKVLFKRGELEVEFGLSYAQSSDRAACFNPNAGSEFCQKDENLALSNSLFTRSVDSSLSVSYGIIDDLALSLSFPYSYSELESDSAPFTINGERVVNHNNHMGIGDISGSLRYTAFHESGAIPGIALNLNGKAPSGDDGRRLGSGFWNVGAGVSLTKTIDPVVFFGSLGYSARLPAGGVDPGDQISYSVGGGFSLNNRVSVSAALSGSAILRTEVHGRETPGSAQNINSLQFSSTIKLTKALFVEPFVAYGLTKEAGDFVFGINVPYRFGDKYPLPFFSD